MAEKFNPSALFYVIHTVRVRKSTYHSTYVRSDSPFMTYINSYMLRHRGAFLRESL